MSVWIITGMSGAGKATALAGLERDGVRCVDNLPVELLAHTAALAGAESLAAVVDARQGAGLERLGPMPADVTVLFLDAADNVLVRRLGESTRPHPCESSGRGRAAISAERELLGPLRAAADAVVDTSSLTPRQLQMRVRDLVSEAAPPRLRMTVSSFGYKHGPQLETEWVVDARMMRNPFWVPELRRLTGLDPAVRDFVMAEPEATELVGRLSDLLQWAAARYSDHGRRFLNVAVGCTGGRHRSVVIAEEVGARLRGRGLDVAVRHRDVERPDPRD